MKFRSALAACALVFLVVQRGAADERNLRKVELDTTCKEPMELAVAPDGRVFFIERTGNLKVWKPDTQSTSLSGKIDVFFRYVGDKSGGGWEDGLIGLTLDPGFATNHWLYVYYSPVADPENRLSRFSLKGDSLDLSSEKILLRVPTDRDVCCHSSGSLAWDADSNLYLSTGDNTNPFESDGYAPIDFRPDRSGFDAARTSGNPHDFRGKILRIKPQPDGSYTVPPGNLFQATDSGTKPEIFVMGCRNPFRISVDRATGTLLWGDVGPDAREFMEERGPAGFDEINRTAKAGNFGWPFFIADNKPYRAYDFHSQTPGERFDPGQPVNESPHNTGRKELPPAQPAWMFYPYSHSTRFPQVQSGSRTAAAGPVYHFQESLQSTKKLPAEYDNCVFIYDWERNWILRTKLDLAKPDLKPFAAHLKFKRPIDMDLGPDGCLYVLEYGTSWGINEDSKLVRLEFASEAP